MTGATYGHPFTGWDWYRGNPTPKRFMHGKNCCRCLRCGIVLSYSYRGKIYGVPVDDCRAEMGRCTKTDQEIEEQRERREGILTRLSKP